MLGCFKLISSSFNPYFVSGLTSEKALDGKIIQMLVLVKVSPKTVQSLLLHLKLYTSLRRTYVIFGSQVLILVASVVNQMTIYEVPFPDLTATTN